MPKVLLVPKINLFQYKICFFLVFVWSLSHIWLLSPYGLQHASLPCPPRVYSNSCPLSWWCYLIISSFAAHFSSCPQSFPASGSFQWVGSLHLVAKELELQHQSFRWIFWQGWFPLGLTSLISLLSRGLSRVFSAPQLERMNYLALSVLYGPTLISVYDYWKNHSFDYMDFGRQSDVFAF